MENSSRSFSILYQDLQYLGAIKTPDPEFWVPGSHQNSGSGVLGTWEPSKLWIQSLGYLGAIKTLDSEFWIPGSHQNFGSRVWVHGSHQNSGSRDWVPGSHQKHCNFQITEQNCQLNF